MAFTSTLNDVSNPYRAIDPGPKASPVAEIAKLAGGLVGAFDQLGQRSARDKSVEAQEKNATALDEVAKANYEYQKGANAALRPQPSIPVAIGGTAPPDFDSSLENLPKEVVTSTNRLVAMGRAVEQKAVTPVAYDLQLETRINDLMQKYPESAYEISNYMQAAGIDSVVFRDLRAKEALTKVQQSAADQGRATQMQIGYATGMSPDADPELVRQQGAKIQDAQARVAASKAKQEATDRDLTLSQEERKAAEKQESDELLRLSLGNSDAFILPLVSYTKELTEALATDPTGGKFSEVSLRLYPRIQGSLVVYKTETINNYLKSPRATPEGAARLGAHLDSQIASVKDLYVGDASDFKMKQNIYNGIQTHFGINAQQSLTILSTWMANPGTAAILKSQFGMGGAPTIPAETMRAISDEINGYKPGSADGAYILNRAGKILTGDLKLEDVTPQEAVKLIQTTTPAFFSVGNDVRGGKATDTDKQQYLNVSNNLLNAARSTSPSEKITPSMEAVAKVASVETLQGLEIVAKDSRFTQAATESILALRATSYRNLEAVRDSGTDVSANGIWKQVYSETQQKFILQPDRKAYNRLLANVGGGQSRTGNTLGSFESQRPPADMTKRVNLMNQYVKVLSWSAKWDESIPKGTGQKELNNRYANDIPLPTVAGQAGQTTQERVTGATGRIEKLLNIVDTGAAVNLAQTQENAIVNSPNPPKEALVSAATSAANKYGIPIDLFHGLIKAESNWDPKADANKNFPNSHAGSLGQVQPGTMEMYGYKPEDRWDVTKNLDVAAHYLSDLIKKNNGNVEKALMTYSGGSYSGKTLKNIQNAGK